MGAYKFSSPRMDSSVSVTASRHELGNQDCSWIRQIHRRNYMNSEKE